MEDELMTQRTYESLNALLLTDLPELNTHAEAILVGAFHSLAVSRLYLQGRLAKLYLKMAEVSCASLM